MNTPNTLREAIVYFADYENCRQFLIGLRWLDGKVRCPICGSSHVSYLESARLYKCYGKHEKAKFSLKVGTIFEDSPLGLEKWLPAMWLIVNAKNGISSMEISRALGITQKSAWFMLHRIREALSDDRKHKFGFGGPVESDETFIGPNPQKMNKGQRTKYSKRRGADIPGMVDGKTAVHGMLDRELRQIRAKVIPNIKRETLQNLILDNVTPFAKLYTDQFVSYDGLQKKFIHKVVDHSKEYVRGQVHTNGIENFWSLLKRTLRGTYVAVEPFHLDRYIDEQVFRFNNRATKDNPLTDADRFSLACVQILGKRLTWNELTGKTGDASSH